MAKPDFKPDFLIALCAALLLLPWNVTLAWILAGFVHEMGHILAIRISGTEISAIRIGAFGAIIKTGQLEDWKQILCALAGPAAGLCLLLLLKIYPVLAICALMQSLVNLLPVYPLDGGRALKCVLDLLLPEKGSRWIYSFIETAILVVLVFASMYLSLILHCGPIPILAVVIFIWKIKFSCKPSGQRVQ